MENPFIVKIFKGHSTKLPHCKEVYFGPHNIIPKIGDHICIEYNEYKVWRVEHVLNYAISYKKDCSPFHARIYVEEEPS